MHFCIIKDNEKYASRRTRFGILGVEFQTGGSVFPKMGHKSPILPDKMNSGGATGTPVCLLHLPGKSGIIAVTNLQAATEGRNMKNKKGLISISLGLLLIAAALFLIAYNRNEERNAQRSVQTVLAQLETQLPLDVPPMPTAPAAQPGTPQPDTAQPDAEVPDTPQAPPPVPVEDPEPEHVIPDYVLNPNMEMPVVQVEGQDYIGVLELPTLDLKLPIISEWNEERLKLAPCRYSGSLYLGDLVIAGHNYQSHFGTLKKLAIHDPVIFIDADGNIFYYEVELLDILEPEDIEEMTSGEWDLTLFTCTTGAAYRIAVRCAPVEQDEP